MKKTFTLVVNSSSFEVHFVSSATDQGKWGYRLAAWASAPKGYCRFAELMMSESFSPSGLVGTATIDDAENDVDNDAEETGGTLLVLEGEW